MSIYGPKLKTDQPPPRSKGEVNLKPYVKKSYVNNRLEQRVAVSGDTMLGDLDMNGSGITNLPEAPTDPKDACSAAYAMAVGRECVTRDGGQGMEASLDLGGHKIVGMHYPTQPQEAATKHYVDTVASLVITIWAEHSGPLQEGLYKFSFGNGSEGLANRYSGYPLLADGKVVRMGISATNPKGFAAGKTAVALVVNSVNGYRVVKSEGQKTAFKIFQKPLEVAAGSAINFVPTIADPDATAVVVALLIQLKT